MYIYLSTWPHTYWDGRPNVGQRHWVGPRISLLTGDVHVVRIEWDSYTSYKAVRLHWRIAVRITDKIFINSFAFSVWLCEPASVWVSMGISFRDTQVKLCVSLRHMPRTHVTSFMESIYKWLHSNFLMTRSVLCPQNTYSGRKTDANRSHSFVTATASLYTGMRAYTNVVYILGFFTRFNKHCRLRIA